MSDLIPGRPKIIGRTSNSLGGINGQPIGVKVRTVAGKRPIDGVTARLGRPEVAVALMGTLGGRTVTRLGSSALLVERL